MALMPNRSNYLRVLIFISICLCFVQVPIQAFSLNPFNELTSLVKLFLTQFTENTLKYQKISASTFIHTDQTGQISVPDEIIITSSSLKPYAEELAKIHESNGITSKIVTVEEIWANYTPAEDPPIFGAANETLKDITEYNYTLAKKIIAFLRTQIGKAEYITLFGDVKIIPPSYYVDLKPPYMSGFFETPTDFFYASPDYDMKPDFAVGRIPVDSAGEAQIYIDKLRDYYNNFSLNEFKNALLYGGKIGDTLPEGSSLEKWAGELSVAHLMWINTTGKFNAKVVMESDGVIPGHGDVYDNYTFRNYVRQAFNDAFSGGYGLVFHSQHGFTDGLQIYGPMYTKGDLDKIKNKKSAVLPIFISEGCKVAAYDTEVVKADFFTLYPPKDKSFAEYLLVIKAGAIASIGASRSANDNYKYEIINGTVNFTDYDYIHVITAKIVEEIGKVETLGEAFKNALTYYSEKYNLKPANPKDDRGKWIYQTFFEVVLLGDPTLKLPRLEINPVKPPKVEILSKPEKYIKVWDNVEKRYYEYPLYEGGLTIYVEGNATVKVFDPVELIDRKVVHGTYTFMPSKYGKYLMRISNGKSEVWLAFYANVTENHAPIVESIGVINATVGKEVIVKINASDPDGDEITCKPIYIPEGAKINNCIFYWTPQKPGNYTIKFEVEDSKGASTKESFKIIVHPKPEKVKVVLISPPNCAMNLPLSVELKIKVIGANTYTVKFYGNGRVIGITNNTSFIWRNLEPGTTYEWYVVVETEYGNFTSEKWNFTTSYAPVANFTYEIKKWKVKFKFTGYEPDGGSIKCEWDFGDGKKESGCKVVHVYSKPGRYNVTLKVTDEVGISSYAWKVVEIEFEKPKDVPKKSNDLDSDGLYEDVNGDGKFNINDIVYFQWHFRDKELQKHKKYYDFWPDGKLDYKDVLSLYVYLKWGYKRW